jgi:hypothetical protein
LKLNVSKEAQDNNDTFMDLLVEGVVAKKVRIL